MGRLDTYGVGQKLWGVAASLLAKPHPIASGPLLYQEQKTDHDFPKILSIRG